MGTTTALSYLTDINIVLHIQRSSAFNAQHYLLWDFYFVFPFLSLFFFSFRFTGQWVHQCRNHNHWKTVWIAFISNGPNSIGLWYGIICVLSASYIFWWTKKCIKTTMDWYRYDYDGFGFNGLFITAFFGWLIQSNKCRGQCLSNGKNCCKYGEFEVKNRSSFFFFFNCSNWNESLLKILFNWTLCAQKVKNRFFY